MNSPEEVAIESIGRDAIAGIGYQNDLRVATRAIEAYRDQLADALLDLCQEVVSDIEASRDADDLQPVLDARDDAEGILIDLILILEGKTT